MITPRYCWNLVLLSLVSFGSHFSISSLSIYGVFLIEANIISPLGMGFLFAANYISSLFLPLLIGYLIDSTSQVKTIAITLLVVTTVGQLLLVFALYNKLFILALVAQALFGSGASSVSAIQRISIAYYLKVWYICLMRRFG
jgi:MFS family permease